MKKLPALHTMTEYSFLESSIKIDDLISFACTHNLEALAITDHNNMFGVAEFVHKCQKNKIKPIIGLDLDVENFRVLLLALNYGGFTELVRLSSLQNFGTSINLEDINGQNLIFIEHPQQQFRSKEAISKRIPNQTLFTTASETSINHIDVGYTRFLGAEDIATIRIVDMLKGATSTSDVTKHNYKLIGPSSASYNRVKKIVDACDVVFPSNHNPIPHFDSQVDSQVLFRNIITKNARLRLKAKMQNAVYSRRLKEEVSIIERLNFQDYFLIIYDLVKWAKEQKILIGPGRGSAAGSLVSYVLDITEVDPISHGLLFERFLNPERVTMPDIDIDIQDSKRELVIDYLSEKYGFDRVGLISTFQRLAARASLREVGRIMNLPLGEVLAITKLIPAFPINISLAKSYASSSRFRAKINSNAKYQKLFEQAQKIEGLPKNIGTHAAGVVITNEPLKTFVPVVKSSEGRTQVQYPMDYLEENGLLKIDLLGLRNLTILEDVKQEIYLNHKRHIDFRQIPHNDPKTNEILSCGNTNGIFQLESHGMKKTLVNVQISSVNDLADVISLYRPGPMEFIKTYASIKNKQVAPKQVDPHYDAIVRSTHGIIVYQEQIMEIAQKYASMSFARADILRRAIGKKNTALIESVKNEFITGSLQNGHSRAEVERVFNLIKRFADYGFNKSHAISYALLGYRMAYLKAWFPFEFYTALIKSSLSSPQTLKNYIQEAKQMKINVVEPKVNAARKDVFNKRPAIFLPLVVIKGLGSVANAKIIDERDRNGKYRDFFDFVARSKLNGISDQVLLATIKANALAEWGNMATLINALPHASRYAAMITKTANGRKDLDFAMLKKPELTVLDADIGAEIENERLTLGFNISLFKSLPHEDANKLVDLSHKKRLPVVVHVLRKKVTTDKNGNEMGIFVLQDSTMEVEALAFSQVFATLSTTNPGQIVRATIEQRGAIHIITKDWEVIKNE